LYIPEFRVKLGSESRPILVRTRTTEANERNNEDLRRWSAP
jgi:hypothetical protein